MAEIILPAHKDFVVRKIRSLLPGVEILAFGSRIRGDAKEYSDLDIALKSENAISLRVLVQLEESIAESQIPFKVDLTDFSMVDDDFRKIILKSAIRW